MFSKLKTRLRKARRNGNAVGVINMLMTANQYRKNLIDYTHKNEILRSLKVRSFGTSPEQLVAFAMDAGGGFLRPIQNRHEITELTRLVQARAPKSVLEIGTAKGGSLFLFCQGAAEDATIVSIDLPYGRNGGGYPAWKTPIYEQFTKPGQKVHLLRTNSHSKATREEVRKLVPGGFELIMIDADHSYEGVKIDFELYSPLLAPGGIVVMHDILHNRFDPEIEVGRYWDEIKPFYNVQEIVGDYNQGNLGLGVVQGLKKQGGEPPTTGESIPA
jgi:predicted O-methyltransferase YrrM